MVGTVLSALDAFARNPFNKPEDEVLLAPFYSWGNCDPGR